MFDERYDRDPLAEPRSRTPQRHVVTLARGLVIEHTQSEWCGAVVGLAQGGLVQLEDYRGKVRAFPITYGFLIDGTPVVLERPKIKQARQRTASGSFAVEQNRARVARGSRIFVEGKHDAELIEQVWGDDLRVEGVVVELLEGADHLAEVIGQFQPEEGRRAGVLLDHLVKGTKETRIAQQISSPYVKVVGHPFIDIWAAVKPARVGLSEWPHIPMGQDWKTGICKSLGWPAIEHADIADAWQRIRGRVRDFRDLDPHLVGRVEELIDFVTQ